MTTYTIGSTSRQVYDYDGEGRRVRHQRQSFGGGVWTTVANGTTWYVYDAFGKLAAEYGAASSTANCATCYLTADMLGSTRLLTDPAGAAVARYDYRPFGEEIFAPNPAVPGSRSSSMCGAAGCYGQFDSVSQMFTGKERDSETKLDFFGARYFSAGQSRFTSSDPLLNSGRPSNPQSWNRFVYAFNNPLRFVDPTGMYNVDCRENDNDCKKHAERLSKAVQRLTDQLAKVKNPVERARLQASLRAFGKENDGNNVNVSFGSLLGKTAGHTDTKYDVETGTVSFEVMFDPSKISSRDDQAIGAAHEGTHISDTQDPRFAAGQLSDFSGEYRAYQTSAWAASALGKPSLSLEGDNGGKYVIWNRSWGSVDDKVLTRFIIENRKYESGKPYEESHPHNPFPN